MRRRPRLPQPIGSASSFLYGTCESSRAESLGICSQPKNPQSFRQRRGCKCSSLHRQGPPQRRRRLRETEGDVVIAFQPPPTRKLQGIDRPPVSCSRCFRGSSMCGSECTKKQNYSPIQCRGGLPCLPGAASRIPLYRAIQLFPAVSSLATTAPDQA